MVDTPLVSYPWIQNVASQQRNGRIWKVFELAEPRFSRDMERDFRIRAIFPYRDWNGILNPWVELHSHA